MPDDPRSHGTDPTLTPSQAFGVAPTSASGGNAPIEPATGRLPDRYAVGPLLGAGGMGEVVLATDQQIEREVAIKRMCSAAPGAAERFVREAKIQGRLDHPAIVPVHELSRDDEGRPFFVMKRLTGTTLAVLVRDARAIPRQKLLRAFADVCLAIEFAHSRGVVHRDLKPANIMLGDFGEVYVLDWGVAQLDSDPDEPGAVLGTPGYIAPELFRGERLDAKADVYALGCILFEILAGEPLAPRTTSRLTPRELAEQGVERRPSRRALDRDIPPELDAACADATQADRAARPTARELAERVERYLDGDRDLALRKSLAAAHLAAARAALGTGDSEAERAVAMREAGRAIALDPHDPAAAQLVGRLVLEPPREVPREVADRVEKVVQDTARSKARMMVKVGIAWFVVVPWLFALGVRSYSALAALVAAIAVNLVVAIVLAHRTRPASAANVYAAAAAYSMLVALVARLFSPFLLAPTVAAISAVIFVLDPRLRWSAVALTYAAAVLVPWLLEYVGALAATTASTASGDVLLHSVIVTASTPTVQFALATFAATTIFLASFVASRVGAAQREAVRSVELQAWHLRQLVRA